MLMLEPRTFSSGGAGGFGNPSAAANGEISIRPRDDG